MPEPEYTDEQIEEAIALALHKQDVKAVPGLLALLALQNPERADYLRNLMLFGLSVAARENS